MKCFVVPLDWRFSTKTQYYTILNAIQSKKLQSQVVFCLPTSNMRFSLQMFEGFDKKISNCLSKQYHDAQSKYLSCMMSRTEWVENRRPIVVEFSNNDYGNQFDHWTHDMQRCGKILKSMNQDLLLEQFETNRYHFDKNDMKRIRDQITSELLFHAMIPTILSIPARPVFVYCEFLQQSTSYRLTKAMIETVWPKMEIKIIS